MAKPTNQQNDKPEDAAAELEALIERLKAPRKAISLHAQSGVFIPGGGGTLDTVSEAKLKGVKMIHLPGVGVFIEYKGKRAFTPDTNLKGVWYEDEKAA